MLLLTMKNDELEFIENSVGVPIEWTLDEAIFEAICKKFGLPSIDLFATRLNNKVDRYAAWHVPGGQQ